MTLGKVFWLGFLLGSLYADAFYYFFPYNIHYSAHRGFWFERKKP